MIISGEYNNDHTDLDLKRLYLILKSLVVVQVLSVVLLEASLAGLCVGGEF